jgi:hypothetical protein
MGKIDGICVQNLVWKVYGFSPGLFNDGLNDWSASLSAEILKRDQTRSRKWTLKSDGKRSVEGKNFTGLLQCYCYMLAFGKFTIQISYKFPRCFDWYKLFTVVSVQIVSFWVMKPWTLSFRRSTLLPSSLPCQIGSIFWRWRQHDSSKQWYITTHKTERNCLHWLFVIVIFSNQFPYSALKWTTIVSDRFSSHCSRSLFILFRWNITSVPEQGQLPFTDITVTYSGELG